MSEVYCSRNTDNSILSELMKDTDSDQYEVGESDGNCRSF
jgi:hypothetical protein